MLGEVLGLRGDATASAHTETFLFQLYPYASVYLGPEGMIGGEARDRVAGFWRVLGLRPPSEPDHLSALLGLYASVTEAQTEEVDKAQRSLWTQSRRALLWEHLLSWLPGYLTKLEAIGPLFYRDWGALLKTALVAEQSLLGAIPNLPLHLRSASGASPIERNDFTQWLLAPVLSGMLLTRSDLQRAARELGLGLRKGGRRFILKSLLSQDVESTLQWLQREAASWTSHHESWSPVTGDIARFHQKQAQRTVSLLATSMKEGTRPA
jgi:hypothetical protein